MSLKREIATLEEVVRRFERLLVRGTLPDVVVIRQLVDGSADEAAFERDYQCSLAEARERGVELFIERTNFSRPDIKLSPLQPLRQDCDMAAEQDATHARKPEGHDAETNCAPVITTGSATFRTCSAGVRTAS